MASVAARILIPPFETALCLSLFGPQPIGWLWVGSQAEAASGSLSAGLLVAFAGSVTTIIASLWALRRLDAAWVSSRPQGDGASPRGMLEPLLVICTVVAVFGFCFWLFFLQGTGPSIAPQLQ